MWAGQRGDRGADRGGDRTGDREGERRCSGERTGEPRGERLRSFLGLMRPAVGKRTMNCPDTIQYNPFNGVIRPFVGKKASPQHLQAPSTPTYQWMVMNTIQCQA